MSRAAWRTRHKSVTALAGTALLLAAASIAVIATTGDSSADSPHVGARAAWPVYHGSALGSGVDSSGVTFSPANSAWKSPVLDGPVFGEPLEATGRVYVATENDTVYALAANTGAIVWSSHVATPVPAHAPFVPCGDISPTVGITGTPVIDLARNEIFVVADTLVKGPSSSRGVEASHRLFGLDLFTGKVELNRLREWALANRVDTLERTSLGGPSEATPR